MKAMFLSFIFLTTLLLVGCEHTVAGLGQDMQKSGKAIQDSVHG